MLIKSRGNHINHSTITALVKVLSKYLHFDLTLSRFITFLYLKYINFSALNKNKSSRKSGFKNNGDWIYNRKLLINSIFLLEKQSSEKLASWEQDPRHYFGQLFWTIIRKHLTSPANDNPDMIMILHFG